MEIVVPLHQRKKDIPLLFHYFVDSKSGGEIIIKFGRESVKLLIKYDWSSNNVRELANDIENIILRNSIPNFKEPRSIQTNKYKEECRLDLKVINIPSDLLKKHNQEI